MCGQSIAYNIYATLGHTNPLFMGFLGYQNVNKEIIQSNITKEQISPKTSSFRGFLYIPINLSDTTKTHEISTVTNK